MSSFTQPPFELRLVVEPDPAALPEAPAFLARWQQNDGQGATASFPFQPPCGPADLAELRWYLEGYMQFPGVGDRARAAAFEPQQRGRLQPLGPRRGGAVAGRALLPRAGERTHDWPGPRRGPRKATRQAAALARRRPRRRDNRLGGLVHPPALPGWFRPGPGRGRARWGAPNPGPARPESAARLPTAAALPVPGPRPGVAAPRTRPAPAPAELLSGLPPGVRAALAQRDGAALPRAFDALDPAEQQATAAALQALQALQAQAQAGTAGDDQAAQRMAQLEPLFQAVARIASGAPFQHRLQRSSIIPTPLYRCSPRMARDDRPPIATENTP
jgi:hypothetical protein